MAFCSKLTGDVIARAMTEEEAEGLDKEHHGEDHSDSCRRLCVDLPDEERVHNIIYARDKHGYYCGHGHMNDDTVDGSLCQKLIVLFLGIQFFTLILICVSLLMMVGLAFDDSAGPVELFDEDKTDHLMREGHL